MQQRDGRAYDRPKRILDCVGAAVGLVVTAPVQLLTAVVVLFAHGRPILFRQPRPGRHGAVFELVKFRTMLPPDANRLTDAERLTRVGRILRKSSLDELPTLWNVLRGEMSFVGPRPLLVQYLERYTPTQLRRHDVRPGITGLAQAAGRNSVSWERRLMLDVRYVDSRSLVLDAKILGATIRLLFSGRGVSAAGHVTMDEFLGTKEGKDVND